jgi:hypothetical protein
MKFYFHRIGATIGIEDWEVECDNKGENIVWLAPGLFEADG